VDAFHVLYRNIYRFSSKGTYTKSNTFSVSVYADGSVRYRYHHVEESILGSDIFSLWGSRVNTEDGSNLWYHDESVASTYVKAGSDVVFCNEVLLGCPINSCVAPGGLFQMYWRGSESCSALGTGVSRSYQCVWAGGLSVTAAAIRTDGSGGGVLSCDVPTLNLLNDTLISVHVVSDYLSQDPNEPVAKINDDFAGRKSMYQISDISFSASGELSRHPIMVRYDLSNLSPECGCSALTSQDVLPAGSYCDKCNICRRSDDVINDIALAVARPDTLDCHGDCLGTAYVDSCAQCSAGLTGVAPCVTATTASKEDTYAGSDFVTQLFFVILIVCCMSCLFSLCMYMSRGLVGAIADEDRADFIFIEGTPIGVLRREISARNNINRGLTEFERDALGVTIYSALNSQHGSADAISSSSECSICLISFKDGDVCRVLPEPCGHRFHMECVDKWFTLSQSCPLCKRSIKKIFEGDPEEDDFELGASAVSLVHDPRPSAASVRIGRQRYAGETSSLEMIAVGVNSSNSRDVSSGRNIDHV
jgi:hypothetical protein